MKLSQKLQELNIPNGSRHIVLIDSYTGVVFLETIWQNEIPDLHLNMDVVSVHEKGDYRIHIMLKAEYV